MDAQGVGAPVEEELRQPLPRRPRWRLSPWRLWLRVGLQAPPTLLLLGIGLVPGWLLLLAGLGTEVEARVVQRGTVTEGFSVIVEYPRQSWSGADYPVREVVGQTLDEWGSLARAKSLPAKRLGRGWLQVVRVESDGKPLQAWSMAVTLAGVAPVVMVGFIVMWGPLAREWWMVAWGRPVQGLVRTRAVRGVPPRGYSVSYEYREASGPGATALLHGTASVTRAQYEEARPGRPLTVLHALWNPRWHVAYPFARFRASVMASDAARSRRASHTNGIASA
jgi:hypothetical protein